MENLRVYVDGYVRWNRIKPRGADAPPESLKKLAIDA
jgi:hypothetical protein